MGVLNKDMSDKHLFFILLLFLHLYFLFYLFHYLLQLPSKTRIFISFSSWRLYLNVEKVEYKPNDSLIKH